jgi:hypothetical protein
MCEIHVAQTTDRSGRHRKNFEELPRELVHQLLVEIISTKQDRGDANRPYGLIIALINAGRNGGELEEAIASQKSFD